MPDLLHHVEALQDEIVGTLRALIRIPSLTGEEAQIGSFLAQKCREIGLDVQIIEAEPGRPNVIAIWDDGEPGPTLLLNDHLDTFPPGPLEAWTHHPYAAEVIDGCVHGRGSIDTKSGVTTLVMAIKALRGAGLRLKGRLKLIFSCDEETGGSRLGIRHLAKLGLLSADMAVVAEPTSMQIEIATKGRLVVEIVTRGRATHGARPWLGHNAILDMHAVIEELLELDRRLQERRHPMLGPSSMNIGTIKGGTVTNLVPSECRLQVERRVLPEENEDSVFNELEAIVQRINATRPEFPASITKELWWPGYLLDDKEPVVQIAKNAFRKVTGQTAKVAAKYAGTDASWINVLAGIPVIMFSPGQGDRAGNVDESVDITDLVTATKVIAQIIHDVLGGNSSGPPSRRAH